MKKQYNVLSIDFDFFQIVDQETMLTCYPDGHDLSTELSIFVWANYYANPNSFDKLRQVTADKDMIDTLKNKLSQCNADIPVLVANSHVKIFDFIKSRIPDCNDTKLNLINVDMHHDMFNSNDKLDCGNWIKFISEEYETNLQWIANPISKDTYGFDDERFDMIENNFDNINPEQIDAIFLCRSDAWLPPHLDTAFDDFLKFLCVTFDKVVGEHSIREPRKMSEAVKQQKQIYDQMRQFRKDKNNGENRKNNKTDISEK